MSLLLSFDSHIRRYSLLDSIKTHKVILKLHIARQEEQDCVEQYLCVQILIIGNKTLQRCTPFTPDPVIFDILAEVLAKALRYALAEVRIHGQKKHGLALKHLCNGDSA